MPVVLDRQEFAFSVPVLIVGGGGCGLCAALAARDGGADVLLLERDASLLGSTAMSTGLIPAAGTPEQAALGIADSPDRFLGDILAKTKGETDAGMALRLAAESADTVAWLRDRHGAPLSLVQGFLYPGHSRMRMYGTPHRTGGELMAALERAAQIAGADVMTQAHVSDLFAGPDGRVAGVRVSRPDGAQEMIGCEALVLACSGFGGNAEMVADWIPEMANAVYHGHPGNRGDSVGWGRALGAAFADMGAYQGHGGLAAGHGVPILWPLIMEGGIQVNALGHRFSNEAEGYSEQAARVNAQPGGVAWSVFDERLHALMLDFEDYQDALRAGAILVKEDAAALARSAGLPVAALSATLEAVSRSVEGEAADPFGRDFTGHPPLAPPYRAAKVTGALFHTQGGLIVDSDARMLTLQGTAFPNLFAGGGAARGISGSGASGYLAGNGLLAATTLGKLAGRAAARLVGSAQEPAPAYRTAPPA